MIFSNQRPIYIQIIEQIHFKILTGEWVPDERIPSVRDLAVLYEVNPNTVMRAYEKLQSKEIIYNKRGMGYFLSSDAQETVRGKQRDEFEREELPKIFEKMSTLGISINDFIRLYKERRGDDCEPFGH